MPVVRPQTNPRKLDQRFELGSTEAIKSLVIAGLGVGFFSCWEIQQEIGLGLVRQINIPGLRIQRMFSWALPSVPLSSLPQLRTHRVVLLPT